MLVFLLIPIISNFILVRSVFGLYLNERLFKIAIREIHSESNWYLSFHILDVYNPKYMLLWSTNGWEVMLKSREKERLNAND